MKVNFHRLGSVEAAARYPATSNPDPDALVFTAPRGGPLARSLVARRVGQSAAARAALPGVTFHGLRHSFVAILMAAGCNVREVSEWLATRTWRSP